MNEMNVIPLGDRLIVRLVHAFGRNAALRATLYDDQPVRGIVIAAGAGRVDANGRSIPLSVTAGDTILFGRRHAQEITVAGTQCWIINADDIVKVEAIGEFKVIRPASDDSTLHLIARPPQERQ